MPRKKTKEVSSKDYSLIKENYLKSGRFINEQIVGSRRNLYDEKNNLVATYVNNNILDLGKLTKEQFFWFMGMFNKNLYKCLKENPDLLDLEIEFRGSSRKKHRENFDKIPIGGFFYNLDLNSAYWQIVYKLGYIDFEFFEKYQYNPDYKVVKRLCISFLARNNRKNYYVDGKEFTIVCDTSALKKIYTNIRNLLYQIFTECSNQVDYIAYNIDSIYIEKKDLKAIKTIFNEMGLQYKLVLCQKTGEKEYVYGNQKRIF